MEWIITFANPGIFKAKANYPGHKLEFLVLKWEVTEMF